MDEVAREVQTYALARLPQPELGQPRAGLALKPGTAFEPYADLLPELDMVLVMTVNPGFGGQPYLATMEPKIAALRALIDEQGHDVQGGHEQPERRRVHGLRGVHLRCHHDLGTSAGHPPAAGGGDPSPHAVMPRMDVAGERFQPVGHELHRHIDQFRKPRSDRSERHVVAPLPLRPAQVRDEDHASALLRQILQCGKRRPDPRVIRDRAILDGNVVVDPDQHPLPAQDIRSQLLHISLAHA